MSSVEIPPTIDEDKIVFKPNPGPQTAFLAASEREVLYGGSAGGGKSYAILADPLRYISHPQFSGLILRHTTEELRELIWKSQELYPKVIPGIKWSERKMQWEAPSGGRLWMSYLDRDDDVLRYQGLSFCVAGDTKVALGNGTFKQMKDIYVGDDVATLEGSNKVVYKSEKMIKECVAVDVYSFDGQLISSQIQPCTHPIALLSSKPFQSLFDWYQTCDTLQSSPVQWQSFEQVRSAGQENLDSSACLKDGQNGSTEYDDGTREVQQLLLSTYPVVLHGLVRQSTDVHASTQFRTFCKSLQLSEDSDQRLLQSSSGLPQPHEPVELHTGRSMEQHRGTSCGVEDALLEKQKVEGSTGRCSTSHRQCDEQLPCGQECDQCCAHTQDDVEQRSRICSRCGGTGCTRQCSQYQSSYYAHPYTKEQRHLEVPVELGFVKFRTLENPFIEVYDITVDQCNHYITFGGIVNRNCYIAWDELTQWSTPFAYNYMRSRLRSTAPDLPVYIRASTNPGNRGMSWVKKMFIDPAPPGKAFWATDLETGEVMTFPEGHEKAGQPLFKRRFIPAKLKDNPYLAANGEYETMLMSLPEQQRRQLLDGDWDISEGAAFTEFNRRIHVIEPFQIPGNWTKFRACDYGYGSHSAVLWFAVDPTDESLVVYRELYVSKVIPEDLATMVLNLERNETISYGILDSSCWHRRGEGPSIAEKMITRGCRWRPADRSAGSRVAGRMEMHRRLQVDPETGRPRIFFFNTCTQIIADLPTLPIDKNNPDDIDTKVQNDHSYDAARYGIMSRPRSKNIFDYDPYKNYSIAPADTTFGY